MKRRCSCPTPHYLSDGTVVILTESETCFHAASQYSVYRFCFQSECLVCVVVCVCNSVCSSSVCVYVCSSVCSSSVCECVSV